MERRKRFEVKSHIDPYSGNFKKDVFVDEELFEWEVDMDSWQKVNKMGPEYAEAAKGDILNHFCDSLSEFMGKKITPAQVLRAFQTGWI